jgi:hypothetical protein
MQLQESALPSRERLMLSKLNTGPVKLIEQACYCLAGQLAAGCARQLINNQYAPGNLDAIKLVAKLRL